MYLILRVEMHRRHPAERRRFDRAIASHPASIAPARKEMVTNVCVIAAIVRDVALPLYGVL